MRLLKILSKPGALVSGWTSAILCFSAASGFWLAGERGKAICWHSARRGRSAGDCLVATISSLPYCFLTSLFSAATFLRSSPGSSIGVSAMKAAWVSRESFNKRRKTSFPSFPFPMCWWRSSFEPRSAFASLQCQTRTFFNPTTASRCARVSCIPSRLTMSYPATWTWQVSIQAATGTVPRRRSSNSATCSKVPAREYSAPAVFSISTVSFPFAKSSSTTLERFHRLHFFPARAAEGAGMQHDVLGTQLQGTLHFTAKSTNSFLQKHRCRAGQIDQVIGVDRERLQIVPLAQAVHDCALVTAEIVWPPLPGAGGENLEGIASQAVGAFRRVLHSAGNGSVNTDAAGRQAWRAFGRRRVQDVLLTGHGTRHNRSIAGAARKTLRATSLP